MELFIQYIDDFKLHLEKLKNILTKEFFNDILLKLSQEIPDKQQGVSQLNIDN